MSALIYGENITYETAFKILVSPTSPQGIGEKRMTYEEVAKKFKVSVEKVESIKNGTFMNGKPSLSEQEKMKKKPEQLVMRF